MSLTKEQLLSPRYKVIADYPGQLHPIGYIYEVNESAMAYVAGDNETWSEKVCLEEYPVLFRKLGWWEDRETSELPLFVKYSKASDQDVCKVMEWIISKHYGPLCTTTELRNISPSEACLVPANEEDYNAYINKQNGTNNSI